jgi:hypothetical protein
MNEKERLNALEIALNNEMRERAFYLRHAARTKNPVGKAMFKQIGDEELEHYERLKELQESEGEGVLLPSCPDRERTLSVPQGRRGVPDRPGIVLPKERASRPRRWLGAPPEVNGCLYEPTVPLAQEISQGVSVIGEPIGLNRYLFESQPLLLHQLEGDLKSVSAFAPNFLHSVTQ